MEFNMIFSIYTLVESIWIILPAYAANGLVPLIKGKKPIDGGRKLYDGMPVFGKGKTWEGLVFGCFIGSLIGLVEEFAFPYLPWEISPIPLNIVPMSLIMGFFLGLGAMLGDMGGSFIKRRLKLKRGQAAPLLDQDDFVVGALVFASFLTQIKIEWVVLLLIITPLFHLIANVVAYMAKIKNEPY
jgi:CDP-2,3-bis-(O-geranylgeranyl)-sn-glycerol synthase